MLTISKRPFKVPGSSHIARSFRQHDELVTNKVDTCKTTIPLNVLDHSSRDYISNIYFFIFSQKKNSKARHNIKSVFSGSCRPRIKSRHQKQKIPNIKSKKVKFFLNKNNNKKGSFYFSPNLNKLKRVKQGAKPE